MFILKKEKQKSYARLKTCTVIPTPSLKATLKTGFQRIVYLEILKHQPCFQTWSLVYRIVGDLGGLILSLMQSGLVILHQSAGPLLFICSLEGKELGDNTPATNSKALFDWRLPKWKEGSFWKRWMKALGRTNWRALLGRGQSNPENIW